MRLYDLEIIEEDAFLKWKEEVNDEFPGKGKALFQVRLVWLHRHACIHCILVTRGLNIHVKREKIYR